ncbi:MAG: DUF4838 domain-containing protein [Verrucomicrobia bacterium]|nr:DUF4838 domain-containing protein [Verrucomicrobiota bacterium]
MRFLLLSVVALFLAACATTKRTDLMLADAGRSDYRIVVAKNCSPSVNYAAQELQTYLQKITGARLPIVTDAEPAQPREILVGRSRHYVLPDGLGKEGYVLRTAGDRLVIIGGEPRGTLYGVYGLLEDHFGCRWFTPEIERVPQARRLPLPQLNERKVPVFEYRETYTWESYDGNWMARNRLNGEGGRGRLLERQNIRPPVPELDARHGGSVKFGFGFFVHTFDKLVPADQYFSAHPEYFALRKGKRSPRQLCCTNEDVIRLCTEAIRAGMRAQPDATVFSLSQSDNRDFCECDRCAALAKAEETGMGPLLHLVNRVAEAVEKEFPDKMVETLAYQWSRQPPKTMRLCPNVVIRLSNIECCFAHPLASGCNEANQKFVKDLQVWAKVCNRLWIWDYTTNYSHYLLPMPNKRLLDDNIRLFAANRVTGVFEQGTYDTPDSEMVALKAYLIAKFLWNPNYDEALATREFLAAYYGAAAPAILQYLNLIHDYADKQQTHVRIFDKPTSQHLTPELLTEANALWEQAELLVKDDAGALDRVRRSRMSVDYAIAELARTQQALRPLARSRFPSFKQTFEQSKLTRIREWRDVDKADYLKILEAEITR